MTNGLPDPVEARLQRIEENLEAASDMLGRLAESNTGLDLKLDRIIDTLDRVAVTTERQAAVAESLAASIRLLLEQPRGK